ncbi:MAG TPA: adenylate/guanylate cyclase domain-containing protein, partial [Candidatus Saccharimonadales bacterium]|nr:adenylate/guanylate cyclase domain-containing protein [Candidatus Saccharimonadales bacterium]
MEHKVNIPNDFGIKSGICYFEPRFVEIKLNDTVAWTNNDNKAHSIISGDARSPKPDHIFWSPVLNPGEKFSFSFRNFFESIPYFCRLHTNERGVITMIQKNVSEMSFRETKEHLDKVHQFTEGEDTSVRATVGPYFDPAILSEISESKESALQAKSIAIVFWDISGFSSLTENLKDAPHLLLGFLQEYYAESIRIVHEYDGIIDKFLGDGIMAYFGKNDDDMGLKGSINAINSALKLRTSFITTKSKWIELWKTHTKQITDINLKCG